MLFRLNVLGENDTVVKTYETSKIKFGLIEDLLTVQDKLSQPNVKPTQQFELIKPILLGMFKGLTEDELRDVEFSEILKTTKLLMQGANNGFEDEDEKN